MKIAIPVLDIQLQKNEISSLHSGGSLCLFDSETGESKWMKFTELAANMGELLPALEQKAVKDIIAIKILPMALKVLVNKGFQVYQSNGSKLDENILSYQRNELAPFDMEKAMTHAASCNGSCDVCATDCQEITKPTL